MVDLLVEVLRHVPIYDIEGSSTPKKYTRRVLEGAHYQGH